MISYFYPQAITLPEAKVKSPPVWQRKDTINYNASEFKQPQDRVIGDIIARLPGIEVSPSGQIKYNGKPINKYYIEGLDLLEDKYGIANNNIPAETVDKIQVMENHQPVRVLDSVAFSDRAALNIKLKSNARLRPIVRAGLGVGVTPLLSEDELTGMLFKKNIQFINTYKYNNTGKDNTKELVSQNIQEYFSAVQSGAVKNDILAIAQPAPPSIAPKRYLFNNAYVFSLNQLLPLKKELQLRINADYVNDRHKQQSEALTKIYLPSDTLIIRENSRYRENTNMLQTSFSLLANTHRYYLKNVFKFQGWWPKEKNSLLATTDIDQLLNNPFYNVSNDYSVIQSKGKHITEWSSYIGYVSTPQQLQVVPGLYIQLLNDNRAYDGLSQQASVKTFYTDNYFSLRNKKGKINGEYKTGFIIHSKHMLSDLQIESGGITRFVADTFQNNLQWRQYKLYNESKWTYQDQRIRISFALPISFNLIKYEDEVLAVRRQKNKLFFEPSLMTTITISPLWSFNTSMYYGQSLGDMQSITKGYILKTYRNFAANNTPLGEFRTISSSFNITYRNPLKIQFFNAGITYNRNVSNLLYRHDYNANLETLTAIVKKNYTNGTTINSRFSKYIIRWKTSFALNGSYTFGNSEQLQQGLPVRLNNKNWNAGLAITTKLSSMLTAEYTNSYAQYIFRSMITTKNTSFNRFSQNCSINYYPSQKIIVRATGEHYHFANELSYTADYYFTDLLLRFKPTRSKIDYELSCQNIMNTRSFITGSLINNIETVLNFSFGQGSFSLK